MWGRFDFKLSLLQVRPCVNKEGGPRRFGVVLEDMVILTSPFPLDPACVIYRYGNVLSLMDARE